MRNFQKANELLKAKGYDLKNDCVDDLIDLIDAYFLEIPDSKLFKNSDSENGCDNWRTYLGCIIEDVYNQINGYDIDQPTTDQQLADLTKFIPFL
jgi:hypothetical protein